MCVVVVVSVHRKKESKKSIKVMKMRSSKERVRLRNRKLQREVKMQDHSGPSSAGGGCFRWGLTFCSVEELGEFLDFSSEF